MSHETGAEFLSAWAANAARLEHTYDPAMEHDNCGVGMVAALDGVARRDVVQAGIDALKAVWHRGAVDADGKTGDGAGIHIEIAPPHPHGKQALAGRFHGVLLPCGVVDEAARRHDAEFTIVPLPAR